MCKICKKCNKPLNQSIRIGGYKSCPKCSQINGYHVFYREEEFGTSDKRETRNNPDGIQSHCTACRGGGNAPKGVSCDDIMLWQNNLRV
ncbi:MAG: hypothetical protein ATN35_10510 [Epulopiscium sp. Nele67-Bin004]|nr:MAG: hypothetical protein ATN35_10510 [Epulopiscium sp. Nele67-Bin004]